jgi:hypothetical protein
MLSMPQAVMASLPPPPPFSGPAPGDGLPLPPPPGFPIGGHMPPPPLPPGWTEHIGDWEYATYESMCGFF